MSKKVVIVGGGFAGLNAAKVLGHIRDVEVTLIDRRNHHLFQPLLYQVATAGLSPADIAAPIRGILSSYKNVSVIQGELRGVFPKENRITTDFGTVDYDYLLLACGASHSYFGKDNWETYAPGLKTIENATEIRRRILTAYEVAERISDPDERRKHLTFVVVGGGPTGVELAGAIGEMSRFTLAKDFRQIDAKSTRVFLMEAGPRILAAFPDDLADRAARDLENLGVQIWTSSRVTDMNADGVIVGSERIAASTVIWAAGVKAESIDCDAAIETDRQGRIVVERDLSIEHSANIFVAGDQANFKTSAGDVLPGLAPVAVQQGRFVAKTIIDDIAGKPRREFKYRDKGIMATVGRNKAIMESGGWKMSGRLAWLAWLLVHVYFLTGFKNRMFVVMQWAWSYITYRRGARLIVGNQAQMQPDDSSTSVRNTEPVSDQPDQREKVVQAG